MRIKKHACIIQYITDALSKEEIKLIKEINKYLTRRFGKKAYRLALLLTKEIEPKTHEGLERMFSLHFVKTEIFGGKDSRFLTILAKYRGNADYNPFYNFTGKDFEELHEQMEQLTKNIREYLKKKKYWE